MTSNFLSCLVSGTWRIKRCNLDYLVVRSFVRSFITNLANTIFLKLVKRFCCKSAQVVCGQGHETTNFGGQEVKDHGHSHDAEVGFGGVR